MVLDHYNRSASIGYRQTRTIKNKFNKMRKFLETQELRTQLTVLFNDDSLMNLLEKLDQECKLFARDQIKAYYTEQEKLELHIHELNMKTNKEMKKQINENTNIADKLPIPISNNTSLGSSLHSPWSDGPWSSGNSSAKFDHVSPYYNHNEQTGAVPRKRSLDERDAENQYSGIDEDHHHSLPIQHQRPQYNKTAKASAIASPNSSANQLSPSSSTVSSLSATAFPRQPTYSTNLRVSQLRHGEVVNGGSTTETSAINNDMMTVTMLDSTTEQEGNDDNNSPSVVSASAKSPSQIEAPPLDSITVLPHTSFQKGQKKRQKQQQQQQQQDFGTTFSKNSPSPSNESNYSTPSNSNNTKLQGNHPQQFYSPNTFNNSSNDLLQTIINLVNQYGHTSASQPDHGSSKPSPLSQQQQLLDQQTGVSISAMQKLEIRSIIREEMRSFMADFQQAMEQKFSKQVEDLKTLILASSGVEFSLQQQTKSPLQQQTKSPLQQQTSFSLQQHQNELDRLNDTGSPKLPP